MPSAAKGVSAPPLYVLEFSSPFTPLLAVRALQGLNQGGGKHTLCEIVADDAKVRGLNCGLDSYPGRGRAPGVEPRAGAPVWCVELKPKCGFVPSLSPFVCAAHAIKRRVCRFCLHQRLKHAQGKLKGGPLSRYCPQELFADGGAHARAEEERVELREGAEPVERARGAIRKA